MMTEPMKRHAEPWPWLATNLVFETMNMLSSPSGHRLGVVQARCAPAWKLYDNYGVYRGALGPGWDIIDVHMAWIWDRVAGQWTRLTSAAGAYSSSYEAEQVARELMAHGPLPPAPPPAWTDDGQAKLEPGLKCASGRLPFRLGLTVMYDSEEQAATALWAANELLRLWRKEHGDTK